MRTRKNNWKLSLFVLTFSFKMMSAQILSPFNKLKIQDTSEVYSFIVSGHFYGASTNTSTFPASTLLANIDALNSLEPSFLMSLGDMFIDVNEKYLKNYRSSLFLRLKMPLINAVGNHDLANGNIYEKEFGKTYFSFLISTELFIVLNTELDDGSIKKEQLTFFRDALNSARSENIKNIFVFSHRPVWAEQSSRYGKLFKDNTRTSIGENNFSSEVEPLLKEISKAKNVFWLSGSMGGGPASFFYDKDEETKITFIQTAIRDLPRDAVLQVNVNNGGVSFKGISLTGETLKPIEDYNVLFWTKTTPHEEKFNFRLLPLMILQMLTHHFFWIGVITTLISCFLILLIIKRWKRKK